MVETKGRDPRPDAIAQVGNVVTRKKFTAVVTDIPKSGMAVDMRGSAPQFLPQFQFRLEVAN
jgi:hypothetical protein